MKFLKKSLVFLLTFIFISSVKIFTFGSAIDYSSMSDGLIPANIAVFASEENFEERPSRSPLREAQERQARRQSRAEEERAAAPKRKARNFVGDDDDFEFEFLDLDDDK